MKSQMSWNVKCYEVNNVKCYEIKMLWNVKCHEISNVMKCQTSFAVALSSGPCL